MKIERSLVNAISLKLMKIIPLILLYLVFPVNVHAYLDLGTGSYFIQLALAAILGGIYSIKLFWKNIKSFFQRFFSKRNRFEVEKS